MKSKPHNKIYINTLNVGDNHYSITGTDNPVDKKYEVEYIRKDVLLKWAIKKMQHYAKLQNEKHQDPTHWGQRNAFQQVIDKLNSLT